MRRIACHSMPILGELHNPTSHLSDFSPISDPMLLRLIRFAFLVPVFAWLLSAGGISACAQERAEPQTPQNEPAPPISTNTAPAFPEEPAPLVQPRLGDGLYIMGEDGKLHPVLAGTHLSEYLEWKKQRELPAEGPKYLFSDVSLDGLATDAEASLTATLTIQITEEDGWVSVPLELHEATLTKFRHEYKPAGNFEKVQGEAGFDNFDRRGGLKWWFQGPGQHVLTLDMIVPLRKTNGVRRLQLTLPTSASSYLRLKLPIAGEQLSLEPITAGAQKTTPAGSDSTILELWRLGQRLDLGWRALPDSRQVKTMLKADSELRIEPTEESILLTVLQLIEPLQGSMKEIEVSLPGGFTVLELKVDGERYRPLEEFPKSPEPLKITLPAATTNRVRLDWILQAAWPASGQLIVEGFNVSECLRQLGKIGVMGFDGYRISKLSATDVYRTNVGELLGPSPILSAYEFRQQPFQLVLGFQKIEPTYSVRPHLFVKMGAKQIEMRAELELDVYRGVLESVQIDWPEFAEQGWVIDRTELPGIVEDIEQDPETGRITLPLAKRLSPGAAQSFRLRATRKIDSAMSEALPLTLPRIIASNPVRTVVVVTHEENVESQVVPVENTETQPLPADFAEKVESLLRQPRMRDFRGPRQNDFLVRSDEQAFEVKLITHPQSITSETRIKVELAEDRMRIEQRLAYDVKYQRVSQLRVLVPRSFPAENVLFSMGTVPLNFEWTGLEPGNSRQARLTLPAPELGEFEIVAHYEIPEKNRRDHQLQIPCVRASDASLVTGRLEFTTDYPSQVTVEDSDWMRTAEKDVENVWTTTGPGETVRLAWSPRKESDIQRFTIAKALLRSAIQQNGQIVCRADYQPEQDLDSLLISLPPDQFIPDAFYWNGLELIVGDHVKELEPGSGTYRLWLPSPVKPSGGEASADREKPVLSVAYHATDAAALNWSEDFALTAPQFPGEVWIEKTIWEIALPVDQHLFTPPEGFTPEFSWTRQGLFWARASKSSAGTIENWMGLTPELEFPWEGNTYRFSYYGPSSSLRFTSMNRSIIVLFGAGLALLAGFLLLKIPFTRNVLTVLVVAFAFALCSVWYLAPMQVLLQPAGLGLLLAIVAVLVDTFFKRQRQANVITLPSPSEYGGSSATLPRPYPEVIGSEDPTAVRPVRSSLSDSQATQHRPPNEEGSKESPPALIGSSITEKPE